MIHHQIGFWPTSRFQWRSTSRLESFQLWEVPGHNISGVTIMKRVLSMGKTSKITVQGSHLQSQGSCKLISSSICDQIAALVSLTCCSFSHAKLGMLLRLGDPSRRSTISRFLPHLIHGAGSLALTAGSYSQSTYSQDSVQAG